MFSGGKSSPFQIDLFFSDLVFYADFINRKSKKTLAIARSTARVEEKEIVEDNHQWRMKCDRDQGEKLFQNNKPISTAYKVDSLPILMFFFIISNLVAKIHGEDNRLYTVQINHTDQFKPSQTRLSLSTKRSSISTIKKKPSSANLQRSLEARSSWRFSNSDLTN